MLPLCGQLVPEPMFTDAQFLDWVRVTQSIVPMSVGDDRRGRKKAKATVEPPPAEPDETEELTEILPW